MSSDTKTTAPATATRLATPTVFVDGAAGTTGLGIRERLAHQSDVAVKIIDPDKRKDPAARAAMLNGADAVILCLPDEAAVEAVALITNPAVKVIDASTAHRTDARWVFGFPELVAGHWEAVSAADRVANPGCYATGAIAIVRPLIDAGLIPKDFPLALPSVSGYSGGGRPMIEAYEKGEAPPHEVYALGLKHKHIPEIMKYTGLARRPMFVPSVGNFRQGMLVQLPLHLDDLPGKPRAADLHEALAAHYDKSNTPGRFVKVLTPTADGKLEPTALNDTNELELRVYPNEDHRHAVVIARLDNLGKGASGAAVQNLKLMLKL